MELRSSGHCCGVTDVPGHTSGEGERVETPSLLGCKVSAGSHMAREPGQAKNDEKALQPQKLLFEREVIRVS